MASRAGVGFSNVADSKQAAASAAQAAAKQLNGEAPNLALLFGTGKHDAKALHQGMRSVIGPDALVVGGSTFGIITNDKVSYGTTEVGVCLLRLDNAKMEVLVEAGMDKDEAAVGAQLAKRINALGDKYSSMVLFYDSVKQLSNQGPILNLATPMLQAMDKTLTRWPTTAGLGLIADIFQNYVYQFCGDRIERQSAMALMLGGGVRMDTTVIHGCRPAGTYHKITKTDRHVILEIDGKPAVDAIKELVGAEREIDEFPLYITLGVNKGDRFGDFREENYANRLVMALDKQRGGLVMFENDLKPGDEFQLMRRSIDFSYIGQRVEQLRKGLGNRRPIAALYIDCAGRASVLCGTEREEAEAVQRALGTTPLFGLYTGVEIAAVGGKVSPLDWTGVLCLLSEA